jgi:hypothetical protein
MRFSFHFLIIALVISAQSLAAPAAYINSKRELVVNGKVAPLKFWSASYDVGDGFATNPLADKYFQDHKYYGRMFSILNWGALGAALTYSASTVGSGSYNSGTFWTIFLIPWLGGIYAANQSQTDLIRAINIYNGVSEYEAFFRSKRNYNLLSKNDPIFSFRWEF